MYEIRIFFSLLFSTYGTLYLIGVYLQILSWNCVFIWWLSFIWISPTYWCWVRISNSLSKLCWFSDFPCPYLHKTRCLLQKIVTRFYHYHFILAQYIYIYIDWMLALTVFLLKFMSEGQIIVFDHMHHVITKNCENLPCLAMAQFLILQYSFHNIYHPMTEIVWLVCLWSYTSSIIR